MEKIMEMIAEIQRDIEEIRNTFVENATKEVKNHMDNAGFGENVGTFLTAFCVVCEIDVEDTIEGTVKNIMSAGKLYELHSYIDVFARGA